MLERIPLAAPVDTEGDPDPVVPFDVVGLVGTAFGEVLVASVTEAVDEEPRVRGAPVELDTVLLRLIPEVAPVLLLLPLLGLIPDTGWPPSLQAFAKAEWLEYQT